MILSIVLFCFCPFCCFHLLYSSLLFFFFFFYFFLYYCYYYVVVASANSNNNNISSSSNPSYKKKKKNNHKQTTTTITIKTTETAIKKNISLHKTRFEKSPKVGWCFCQMIHSNANNERVRTSFRNTPHTHFCSREIYFQIQIKYIFEIKYAKFNTLKFQLQNNKRNY